MLIRIMINVLAIDLDFHAAAQQHGGQISDPLRERMHIRIIIINNE